MKIAVVGETSMAVRFRNSVVDLQRVRVIENCSFDVILGLDWILQSGAVPVIRDGEFIGVEMPSIAAELERIDQPSSPEIEDLPIEDASVDELVVPELKEGKE